MTRLFLGRLNGLDRAAAIERLLQCCECPRWAELVADACPFTDGDALLWTARDSWESLPADVRVTALNMKPQIGDLEELKRRYGDGSRDAQEQSGVAGAPESVLERLRDKNIEYRAKFGFIFVVFATGKGAAQMLALLEARLPNDDDTELRIATEQNWLITERRILGWLEISDEG